MKVRVKKYINVYGEKRWGVEIKRWWVPLWIRVDWFGTKAEALLHADTWAEPDITEVK